MLLKCCTQYVSKFGKLSSGHRTRKISFHSNPKEGQCQRMFRLPHNCIHFTCLQEKEMATHSSILAWKIPWMEEPGRLQSTGLQRAGHDWVTELNWHECNCVVVWTFFDIALWDWNENWPLLVLWSLLSFPNLLTYWVQHFNSTFF